MRYGAAMSSELLEDIEDKLGNSVFVTLVMSGHANLTLMSGHDRSCHECGVGPDVIDFELTPDKDGFEIAEKIESALRAWREKVQTTLEYGKVET